MDRSADRARERDAFREFLEKHRYAPQGRFARVGMLEEKDLDALGRGTLGPVWAWAWKNIKNAEDMETIKRNVNVAKYSIDSCKQEREQAKAKRDALINRKKYLEESLRKAREREQTLLAGVRGVEREQRELVNGVSDRKQRELLRRAFNEKNKGTMRKMSETIDQAMQIASTVDISAETTNQVHILLAEYKRMLKAAKNAENVDFGESDISHLRDSSGANLSAWILEAASQPLPDLPDDEEDAKYAAHVAEHSNSSHDALLQIQALLRQSQAEHIASFVTTQKTYVKAKELKQRIDQLTGPESNHVAFWGAGSEGLLHGGEHDLALETVDLQIQSQATAVALNFASRAYDEVSKQVDSYRQQKQDLDHKVSLMNQFEERQQDIVAQIRSKYRQNQELLGSLTRKQSRMLQVQGDEILPRTDQNSSAELTVWQRLVMEELRAFSSLRLARLDTATTSTTPAHGAIIEHSRVEKEIPFEEFYISQLEDGKSLGIQPQVVNGYKRMARALGSRDYSSWKAILGCLQEERDLAGVSVHEVSEAIRQLEQDIAEDRAQTVPETQALLSALHQLAESVTSVSLSRLQDVVHVNNGTLNTSIPELSQAIDDWYNQPAWSARLQAGSPFG